MHPPLRALRDAIQALSIEAGLLVWRMDRQLAAASGGARLVRVPAPSPSDGARTRPRLWLTWVSRASP